jgi:hypothetical protein
MKNNSSFHIICLLVIFASALGVYLFTLPKPYIQNNICRATVNFKLNDVDHDFAYTLFIRLYLTDSGKGNGHIRGEVINDGKKYTMAKTLSFSYQSTNKNHDYDMTIENVKQTGQDNVPKDLAEKYLSYTLPKSFIFLKVDEIDRNMMLVSGAQGPLFICSLP